MLVNVSRFNSVQAQVRNLIELELKELRSAIETWAMGAWDKSPTLKSLHRIWDREYAGTVELHWEQIRVHLNASIASISSALVNMKGGSIEYERAPSTGLHVIGVGGLALARGLTLEGLLVSYALRNIGAADTLLQMGRWFGYRPGFENLCRIHVTSGLIEDFREVSESVEELRADFRRMALLGKTPHEFGLKVRQSSTGIAITAKNKMRSAAPLSLAEDFSARHLQAYAVYDKKEANESNRSAVDALVARLTSIKALAPVDPKVSALVWQRVPAGEILALLKNLQLPQTEFNALETNGTSLVGAYVEDRMGSELMEWDVAIPFVRQRGSDSRQMKFPYFGNEIGTEYFCRTRSTGERDGNLIRISAKNAVAFGTDDLKYGESRELLAQRLAKLRASENPPQPETAALIARARARPLLVIHLINLGLAPRDPPQEAQRPHDFGSADPVVTISIVFPGTAIPCKERRYFASARLVQLLAAMRASTDTDEEPDDE
jgi:hypothetical protein